MTLSGKANSTPQKSEESIEDTSLNPLTSAGVNLTGFHAGCGQTGDATART